MLKSKYMFSKSVYSLFILVFFSASRLLAQHTDSVPDKKSKLTLGIGYSSNSVFLGRADSITIPLFNASLTYTLKSGIFFNGSVNYIPSRETNKLDGGSIGAGYDFEHNNLSGGLEISKYLSSDNSTLVIAALSATIGASLSYNIADFITPTMHAEFALGKSGGGNDIILTPGLTHDFSIDHPFSAHDNLSINPGIFLNAGTQNFYSTYYLRKDKRTLRLKSPKNATTGKKPATATSVNTSKLVLLDYEFIMPVNYTCGKFGFELTPSYARAVNTSISSASQTTSVDKTAVFYVSAGVTFTF